jgi:ABC-2 type transport system ATP-binding protein
MSWGARDVTVRFGQTTALDRVSLDAADGEVTVVVGGDGAGKTTVLRVLAGVVTPDAGKVRRPVVRRIGYLASTSGTYPDLSVEENLVFAATAYGVPPGEIEDRLGEYLDRTGLGSARDKLASELSGGMRQKLGVIRAMIHRPRLLVLDEPTTGIDPVSRADLWWLIAQAAADGAAVVLATTYLDEADRASRLLVLNEGRTLAQGTPAEIERSVPGKLLSTLVRPEGEFSARAWRRGKGWRVWIGSDDQFADGEPIVPDLQDAVTVAALAQEVEVVSTGGGE